MTVKCRRVRGHALGGAVVARKLRNPRRIEAAGNPCGVFSSGEGAARLRFVFVLMLLAAAVLAALFFYGQMIEPEQEMIEQEAINAD